MVEADFVRNYDRRLDEVDAEGGARFAWVLLKGLPADAATWRPETLAFSRIAPGTEARVHPVWAMFFEPPLPPPESDGAKLLRFFGAGGHALH